MPRCLSMALAAVALAAPVLACAQAQRALPQNTLRGVVEFGQPPEVLLNGQPARLAPAVRIRDVNNMLVLSGALVGQKLKVNYSFDTYGLLINVWILQAGELKQNWPTTAKEAATWTYDPITFNWIKP